MKMLKHKFWWMYIHMSMGFPGGSVGKISPASARDQETQVRSLREEDPLEKEMATYSSILAGKSHGQRSLVGYQSMGSQRVRQNWATSLSFQKINSHNPSLPKMKFYFHIALQINYILKLIKKLHQPYINTFRDNQKLYCPSYFMQAASLLHQNETRASQGK